MSNRKRNAEKAKFKVGQMVRITSVKIDGLYTLGTILPITEVSLDCDHPVYTVGTGKDTGFAFGHLCCACDIEAV